ncbi:MAG: glycosyltransferase family 39 protein [Deinococcus sp.]|nr:glycosyltransferase family 39 protein [Deinococcus sp.]
MRGSPIVQEALLFGALALLVRVLPATLVANLSPDAVEYLNIGQHLARGDGLVLSIKFHYFNSLPVVHSALADRPPLYPLLVGLLWALWQSQAVVQLASAALGALNVLLLYLMARQAYGWRAARLAAAALVVTPPMFGTSLLPWSEQLSLVWVLLALWLYQGYLRRPWVVPAIGILCALAYLTRQASMAVLVCLLVLLWLDTRRWSEMALALASFALALAPLAVVNLLQGRGPLASSQQYHFVVARFTEGMWWGFSRQYPTPWGFIAAHPLVVAGGVLWNLGTYILNLVWWLAGVLPALPRLVAKGSRLWATRNALIIAAGTLVLHSLVWSTTDAFRFMLVPVVVLLPPLAAGLLTWVRGLRRRHPHRSRWAYGIALFLLLGLFSADVVRVNVSAILVYLRQGRMVAPALVGPPENLGRWLGQNTPAGAVVAAVNPWMPAYLSHRPAVLLPVNLTGEQLQRFLAQYQVEVVVVDTQDPLLRPQVPTYLETLEAVGSEQATFGHLVIFSIYP